MARYLRLTYSNAPIMEKSGDVKRSSTIGSIATVRGLWWESLIKQKRFELGSKTMGGGCTSNVGWQVVPASRTADTETVIIMQFRLM